MENDSEKTQDAMEDAKLKFIARVMAHTILPLAVLGFALFLGRKVFPGPITDLVDNFFLILLPIVAVLFTLHVKTRLKEIQGNCSDNNHCS